MLKNLLSAAVMIGALRVNICTLAYLWYAEVKIQGNGTDIKNAHNSAY